MVSSDIELINTGLIAAADEVITSLDDNTKAAKLCKALWPIIKDSILSIADWNCAVSRQILVRDATEPVFGYDYQYILPTIPYFLVARGIQFEEGSYYPLTGSRYGGETDPDFEFAIEGRKLLTNAEEVNLVYTSRITDPTLYSGYLLDVFKYKLAAEVCYSLTGSASKTADLDNKYTKVLKIAKNRNGQEGMPKLIESLMLRVRR